MTSKKLKTRTAINWSYRPFDCNLGKLPKTFESGSMEAKPKASSNQSSQLAPLWLRPGQGRVLMASEWLSGNPAEWCKLSTPLAETGPSLCRSFRTSDQLGGWWESNKGLEDWHLLAQSGPWFSPQPLPRPRFLSLHSQLHKLSPLPWIFVYAPQIPLPRGLSWDPLSVSFKAPFFK